ncbi:YciI family protein [Nonomuraea rhodomycinica]|uniref:YciI family protein n=1 Tax=Nonomuraea rhodomycinica TaxID=1712872 RepID=UPI0028AC7684|nr:YciI family protein [Nonomuraea rhodomycinica]
MKFLLNLYLDAADPPGEGFDADFLAAAGQAGELVSAHAFAHPSISAVVRVREGVVTVTEGPYPRTSDHVAGQYVLDCENRERAVELAGLMADGRSGGVEVRPLMDSSGMEM